MRAQWFAELAHRLRPDVDSLFYSLETDARSLLWRAGIEPFPRRLTAHAALFGHRLAQTDLTQRPDEPSTRDSLLERQAEDDLRALIRLEGVNVVVLWGGWGHVSRIAVRLARELGLATVFLEEGPVPLTMQIDADGVGFASSFSRRFGESPASERQDGDRAKALVGCERESAWPPAVPPPRRLAPSPVSRLPRLVRRLARPRAFAKGAAARLIALPGTCPLPQSFVLIPFQVFYDPHLIFNSPPFASDFRALAKAVREALQHIAPGTEVVVKLHPAEVRATNVAHVRSLGGLPGISVTLDAPLAQLLDNCRCVVTVNSTVGFQALLRAKPVVALGRSFYAQDGIVHRAVSEGELPVALARALESIPDAAARERFIGAVASSYITYGHWRDFGERSFAAVIQRFRQLFGC